MKEKKASEKTLVRMSFRFVLSFFFFAVDELCIDDFARVSRFDHFVLPIVCVICACMCVHEGVLYLC